MDEAGNQVYTITFDADGGSPAPPTQQVPNGEKITEPDPVPTKENLIFAGWFTASGEKFNFNVSGAWTDLRLTARWWEGPEQFILLNGIDLEFKYPSSDERSVGKECFSKCRYRWAQYH